MQPRAKRQRATRLTKSEQMARVRSQGTDPELKLRRALWGLGFRYRLRQSLPGTPDLTFPARRLAVFVDGCFWHGCPDHYVAPVVNAAFWEAKLARNQNRDRTVDAVLQASGWQSLRLWEHEVNQHPGLAVARVADALAALGSATNDHATSWTSPPMTRAPASLDGPEAPERRFL